MMTFAEARNCHLVAMGRAFSALTVLLGDSAVRNESWPPLVKAVNALAEEVAAITRLNNAEHEAARRART